METDTYAHLPVLLEPVLHLLQPERGGVYIDGTFGLGGHAAALFQRAGEAEVQFLGIDRDPFALRIAAARLPEIATLVQSRAADMHSVCRKEGVTEAQGILLDLGVSSYQLEDPARGFSFRQDGPLDMRMDPDTSLTAAEVVNRWPEPELVRIFFSYGEERYARKIARLIVQRRQKSAFTTTTDLADVVTQAYPPAQRHRGIHPATRIFQALRIAVNDELVEVAAAVQAGLSLLAPVDGRPAPEAQRGVLAVIAFHSLEDRIVKRAFLEAAASGPFEILTKKPLVAEDREREANPRARSAKLRAIRRLPA
jgi:16S rRNA (cytosine1402-N4)-methyltransferase